MLPELLSLEAEGLHVAQGFFGWLIAMGYSSYKVCRQYIYTPSPCEQNTHACGSGLFGDAAVDYLRGPKWNDIANLRNDTAWGQDFAGGLDWFDIHVKLSARSRA
eukprot:gnl/TRDRNA2_/TRDRNA2_165289_c0_seq3.p1 gnl/TRDRNA2_/TRDRNA2_165289_c0~~gnl/TRDRNA2_/TRDRNA2_165289_c0_seq3.p1  ORF type:complete len:105 (+),score=9.33 gnl/TRDRNA2_/TRDRNA2_165289_c0_seq3:167-481(+)